MEPCRILIADDHPIFRDGLLVLLETAPDLMVIGEATTGDEAIARATELRPDVILMDLKMPGCNGIEATQQILADDLHVNIAVMTMFDDDDSVFAAVRAGARGYLLKGASQEETLRAIRAVANGEAIFGPGVARRVMAYFGGLRPGQPGYTPEESFPELTDREYEILGLIAQRRGNAEIAEHLFLSPKTVRNHVSNIFRKLQVANRTEAMLAARLAGLGRHGE